MFIYYECVGLFKEGWVMFLLIGLFSQIDGTANTTEYGYAVIKNVNDFNCVLLFQGRQRIKPKTDFT